MAAIVLQDSKGRKMSDEEFEKFCQQNEDLRIERNSNLEISVMSPNTPLSGSYGANIVHQLVAWNNQNGRKGVVFDSSAGFTLDDNSILSPDASWMSNEKWLALSNSEKDRFSHACPDFVIEIKSKSDSLKSLQQKMEVWISNGAKLGWLIDPKNKSCLIYEQGKTFVEEKSTVVGTGPVEGFYLELSEL